MTIENSAQRIAACWQKLLRLEDWDVTVHVVKRYEMEDPNNLGECHADEMEREATILVLHPEELPEEDRSGEYIERVVIHELLHLFGREARLVDMNGEEIMVRKMTKAICTLLEAMG